MSPAVARVLDALRGLGHEVHEEGRGFVATCPAHEDAHPSLHVEEGDDGRALLKCRAGCDTKAIVAALDLKMKDLFSGPKRTTGSHLTVWKIEDESGNVVAEHHRIDYADGRPKKIFWMSNGKKGLGKRKLTTLPLYGLRALLATAKPATVVFVEGEKAADALLSRGVLAVGTVTGANVTPSREVLAALADFDVVLWPDHDDPGRDHMRRIAQKLPDVAVRVRMLKWPEARERGDDAADFFERGGSVEQANAMIDAASESVGTTAASNGETPDVGSGDWGMDESLDLPGGDDARPSFQYEKGKGHEAVSEACRALAEIPGVFERGHKLVRIVGHEATEEGDDAKVKREAGTPVIAPLPAPTLWETLSRARKWLTYSKREQGLIPIDPPQAVVSAVLARTRWPGVQPLLGIVGHPVLRPDGTILDRAGYDSVTGLYLIKRTEVPQIPERPTREEAIAARDLILDIVSEFEFVSDTDRACWLAAFLTPIARPAFDGPAPMFLADSSMAGGGKTLLCDVISVVATGYKMPRSPYDESDEEIRKRILAHGLAGDAMVLIDNAPNGGSIGWPSLDAALTTSGLWKDRVLGKSENAEVPLKITWFVTGNNISVCADSPRRVLRFRLEPEEEHPEEKSDFKYPRLLAHVRTHRGELLAAALTILRGYIVADRPKQTIATIGSFEDWSDFVQSAVAWVGLPDPGLNLVTRDLDANPEATAHVQLLSLWPTVVPAGRGITTAELLATVAEATGTPLERVRESILELCPGRNGRLPEPRQLGTRFRALKKRWRTLPDGRLAALSPEQSKTRGGLARWRVVYRVTQGVQGMQGVKPTGAAADGRSGDEDIDDKNTTTNDDDPNLPFSAAGPAKTPCTPCTPCKDAWEDDFEHLVVAMEIDGGIAPEDCNALVATVVASTTRFEEAA